MIRLTRDNVSGQRNRIASAIPGVIGESRQGKVSDRHNQGELMLEVEHTLPLRQN
jgi:hypothetical protein